MEIKSNSTKFLKIDEGKPANIRLIGDPVARVVHGFGKDEIECIGEGCEKCLNEKDNPPKERFKANVYNWTLGKVQVWDFSAGMAKQLREIAKSLNSEQKSIEEVDLKVSASGSQMSKKYTILPWPSTKELPPGLALFDIGWKVSA